MRIGIDLGGTKIAGVVLCDRGRTLHSSRVPTPVAQGYEAVIAAVRTLVARLEHEAGRRCTVGVGAPGQISRAHGSLKNSNALCLNDRPLMRDLEAAMGRRIRLENDANCFALSESIDGAAARYPLVFGVILGTGVGGGVVYRRRLLGGRHGIAGEWGHNPLDAGPACYCGRSGCIETMLSGPGLYRDYVQGGGRLAGDAAQVARLAHRHEDPAASAALKRYCSRLGRALAQIVNVLDPDAIVLGGGLSNIDLLYSEALRAMRPHVFNDELTTPLLRHAHGDASGVRGAAMLWPKGRGRHLRSASSPPSLYGDARLAAKAVGSA